ncbi:hypothetical protein BKA66DRAFT_434134 [Pyrenochaeta sp. MPI-SDFR-AT-0127]|nr:hypothetical protein BKA66DRAFT_434134 [Pyrenochaeta sp. MPI-SDFR-AT-0127]
MQTITQGQSPDYETLRARYFNGRLPTHKPVEIATPTCTDDVKNLIISAKARGLKVGVRSGGHLFPACSLIENGMLIDTCNLNRSIGYNTTTKCAALGPAITVREAANQLTALGRFFPFGHHPSVGLGGFLLAGGQGWFLRGWGCTADTWVERMEVVVSAGEVMIASREQNCDIFWAARGSGQGFFGVVTRIWVRTMPAKSLFDRCILFDASKNYQQQLEWVLEVCDRIPKFGTDIAIVTYWSDALEIGEHIETRTSKLNMMIAVTMYADSKDEAATMVAPLDNIPESLSGDLMDSAPTKATTWQELFDLQDAVFPPHDRWQCDSILTDRNVSYKELADLSGTAMCRLPTRWSVGTICVADYFPNELDQALSLPQKHYVSTMTRWKDAADDESMRKWMHDAYEGLEKLSVGQYIADFDVNQRVRRVMTDSALKKWLLIRAKWDPDEMFAGYKGFKSILDQPS